VQPVEKMADTIRAYREAQTRARPEDQLTRVKNQRVGAYTLVHCYDDPEDATAYGVWDSVNWWYRNLAEFTLQWELAHVPEEEKAKFFPLLEARMNEENPAERFQQEDMIIVGTPDECLRKMERYEEAGVDQLLCYIQFGDLPHEKVMRNLELLSTEVIPVLETRGHRVQTTVSA
jgi:alkanesulfonate monooxygenase SsuD/methylene tetrahydromethanopterin reductase-like flavin-dependent oxidoreductase (luciferase family)